MKAITSLAVLIMVALTSVSQVTSEVSEDVVQMALKWAPLVWMHGEDPFYPPTVDFFLDNTEVRDANETLVNSSIYRATLIMLSYSVSQKPMNPGEQNYET